MDFKSKELRAPALRPFRRFVLGELKRDKAFLKHVDRGDALHDFRVSARKVHTWVKAIGPVLNEDKAKPVQKSLRKLLDNTTELRDEQVHRKLLRRWREDAKGEEKKSLELAHDVLAHGGKKDKKAAARLRKRFSQLTKRARKFVKEEKAEKKSAPLARVLSKTLGHEAREFVAIHKRAEADPSPENLHHVRIGGKKLRYLIDPFKNLHSSVPALVTELKELQDDLGYIHDLDVLLERLRKAAEKSEAAATLELAIKRCQRQRERKAKKVMREWFGEHGHSLSDDVKNLSRWFEEL